MSAEIMEEWALCSLQDERWYKDKSPGWNNLPAKQAARLERLKRLRLLKTHGNFDLSTKLKSCGPNHRCHSGCCPECGRAFQRLFASEAAATCDPSEDYSVVTLVGKSRRGIGRLDSLKIERIRQYVLRHLEEGNAGIAVGGIDFSFNEMSGRGQGGHWKPHLHLLIHNAYQSRWEQLLRRAFSPSETTSRPVKITAWDGRIDFLGYMLKTNFERRISVVTHRFARGGFKQCRNTSYDRLRAGERVELFAYLHKIGLTGRALTFGIRISESGFDVSTYR